MFYKVNKGKSIIFSAPSGSGKSTIVNALISKGLPIEFSISATNRLPRGTEKDGKEYYFLSTEQFKLKIDNNEFLEWEEVYKKKYYGTLSSEVGRIWNKGKHVVFDIDVFGGLNLKKKIGNQALAIFIQVPSLCVLHERLKLRKTETEAQLSMRIEKSAKEMSLAKYFDLIIVNDSIDTAIEEALKEVTKFIHG